MTTFDERVNKIMVGLGITNTDARTLIKSHIRGAYFDGCSDEAEQWAGNNTGVKESIAAAVQAENEAMQSVAPSILSVNTKDVLGWDVMTKDEKRMWYAGYLCGVADYTEAIRARNGAQEEQKA